MIKKFDDALSQLERAVTIEDLPFDLMERLRQSEREIAVTISVVMDDGVTKLFTGYRVQHNSARGPYKGGIRFHPTADLDEVRALSFSMTLKTAVVDVAMGGGKGGVEVDARELSAGELERLSRGYVQALWRDLGPELDIPAPDIGTTPEVMSWMLDEYQKLSGDTSKATFTGKSVENGGSLGRDSATGLGGLYVFDALREGLGIPEGAIIAVQGMGSVGGSAATIFAENGYKVVAMSEISGGIYNPEGLNPEEVKDYLKEHGSLASFPGALQVTNAELLELPVDVLIPAAAGNQITKDNVDKVQAKSVLELANGPTTSEADTRLHERGIPVIPDILANAGGVIVSTFEWEQNRKNETWSAEGVEERLKEKITAQAKAIADYATTDSVSLRTAAFKIALERISEQYKEK